MGAGSSEQVGLTETATACHGIVPFTQGTDVELIVIGYTGGWVTDTDGATAMAVARHVVGDVPRVRSPRNRGGRVDPRQGRIADTGPGSILDGRHRSRAARTCGRFRAGG